MSIAYLGFFSFIFSACVGVLTTWICICLLRPVALQIGLVDIPGGRKKHVNPVPLIGGLSIFLGFSFALLFFNISLHDYRGLLAGSLILILIGVIDDFRELTPRIRLAGQGLATLLLIEWGHVSLVHLGNLFYFGRLDLGVGFLSLLFTIFIVMSFINAINMIDGHDGLAGLIALGQALLLAFYNLQYNQIQNVYLLLIFSATLSVFLFFNMPLPWQKRASIFLGDAGSTFIGFFIAWFAVTLSQLLLTQQHPIIGFNLVTVLWILAYPLYDLLSVILYRLCTRRSAFMPSHDHFHFLLTGLHFKRSGISFLLLTLSLSLGLFGLFLAKQHIHEFWQLLIFVGVFIIYFLVSLKLHSIISSSSVASLRAKRGR